MNLVCTLLPLTSGEICGIYADIFILVPYDRNTTCSDRTLHCMVVVPAAASIDLSRQRLEKPWCSWEIMELLATRGKVNVPSMNNPITRHGVALTSQKDA